MIKTLAGVAIFAVALSGFALARDSGGDRDAGGRDSSYSRSTADHGGSCYRTINGVRKWHRCRMW
jgi:hypothetical protein